MPLKLIVGTETLSPPLTGIGYYNLHLLRELLKRDRTELEIMGLGAFGLKSRDTLQQMLAQLEQPVAPKNAASTTQSPTWRHRLASGARTRLQDSPALSNALRLLKLNWQSYKLGGHKDWVQHIPYFIAPVHAGPTVITVHDLSHIHHPETHPSHRVRWLNAQLPKAIERAAHVITDTEFVRTELLELGLVTDPAKVTAIHLGSEAAFRPRRDEEMAPVLATWALQPRRYIHAVATLEPRKNLRRLLDAYRALPATLAAEYPLVLTGAAGWKNAELMAELERVRPPHRVVVTGYLDRNEVQCLMAGAAVFAYPSLYEGFGLPVLEALASGTPVLTSSGGATAEVVGDSGYCVDPLDVDAIGHGLQVLLDDSERAEQLRSAGLARAQQFSWQRCAEEHLRVYRKFG